MGLDQLESTVLALSPNDRREFARWFYSHEGEIWGENEGITESVLAELDRRSGQLEANPSLAVPVTDEWFEQLRRKFAEARAVQTPAR